MRAKTQPTQQHTSACRLEHYVNRTQWELLQTPTKTQRQETAQHRGKLDDEPRELRRNRESVQPATKQPSTHAGRVEHARQLCVQCHNHPQIRHTLAIIEPARHAWLTTGEAFTLLARPRCAKRIKQHIRLQGTTPKLMGYTPTKPTSTNRTKPRSPRGARRHNQVARRKYAHSTEHPGHVPLQVFLRLLQTNPAGDYGDKPERPSIPKHRC